jgi:hypothetical protein
VDEARRRIVEAMALFVDDATSASLVDDVKLPATAQRASRDYILLRRKAEQEDRKAAVAARRAVRMLRGGRLKPSARDAAGLLGLSHQRVHQLTGTIRTNAAGGLAPAERARHRGNRRDHRRASVPPRMTSR